ncbi:carboxylesterase family protein, partial [Haematomicrobium sanguinis]|uniref:carboxylesterase family protein n=1 Tax=Haematomicrobium sanguinis TaxID=479106 RepID=UPI000550AA62
MARQFRGIKYASAARFGMPHLEKYDGDAASPESTHRGAARVYSAWQNPLLFDRVVGDMSQGLVFGEDCLNLNVTVPDSRVEGDARAVVVYIHGGAYVAGSAQIHGYDPSAWVDQEDIVVVNISYRLGAFGFMELPGITQEGLGAQNLGLWDMVTALKWVRDNIARFGGDPDKVTIMGHSAGADAITHLLTLPEAAPLFRRAIVQSAPLGLRRGRAQIAEAMTAAFVADLGSTDARTASPQRLIQAQEVAGNAAGKFGLAAGMPFSVVPGKNGVSDEATAARAMTALGNTKDVLIGYTHDDILPFILGTPTIELWHQNPLAKHMVYPLARAINPGMNRIVFAGPAMQLADQLTRGGSRVYSYRFDWRSPESEYRACHTIELPFLLGDRDAWQRAPMLQGASWADIAAKGAVLKNAWAEFARTGNPTPDGSWPAHRAGRGPSRIWPNS